MKIKPDHNVTIATANPTTQVIKYNPALFRRIKKSHRKYILAHEEGHLVNNSGNEFAADAYAFNKLAGTHRDSLRNSVSVLSEILPPGSPLRQERIKAAYIRALKYDAANGHKPAILELKKMGINPPNYNFEGNLNINKMTPLKLKSQANFDIPLFTTPSPEYAKSTNGAGRYEDLDKRMNKTANRKMGTITQLEVNPNKIDPDRRIFQKPSVNERLVKTEREVSKPAITNEEEYPIVGGKSYGPPKTADLQGTTGQPDDIENRGFNWRLTGIIGGSLLVAAIIIYFIARKK
jgi:hypothetical protein